MKGYDEIVGVQIGATIHRDLNTIRVLMENTDEPIALISRAHMALMACCDLGPKWKRRAEATTLFHRTKGGDYRWPDPKVMKEAARLK